MLDAQSSGRDPGTDCPGGGSAVRLPWVPSGPVLFGQQLPVFGVASSHQKSTPFGALFGLPVREVWLPNIVSSGKDLKSDGTSPMWLPEYWLSHEVETPSPADGQWMPGSTSPSASPATASGIEISIVPWRQL